MTPGVLDECVVDSRHGSEDGRQPPSRDITVTCRHATSRRHSWMRPRIPSRLGERRTEVVRQAVEGLREVASGSSICPFHLGLVRCVTEEGRPTGLSVLERWSDGIEAVRDSVRRLPSNAVADALLVQRCILDCGSALGASARTQVLGTDWACTDTFHPYLGLGEPAFTCGPRRAD